MEFQLGPNTAVLLDAAGTLIRTSRAVARVYAEAAARYGVDRPESDVGPAFGESMIRRKALRQRDPSWRRYWAAVIADATGCADPRLVEELYAAYARAQAWAVADGAVAFCRAARRAGARVAVVSNFDDRLRPLLQELGLAREVDEVFVSGEMGVEKPSPAIFLRALETLGVDPGRAVHVGDSRGADIQGALGAGLAALHMPDDVADFLALRERVIRGS